MYLTWLEERDVLFTLLQMKPVLQMPRFLKSEAFVLNLKLVLCIIIDFALCRTESSSAAMIALLPLLMSPRLSAKHFLCLT